MQRRALLILLTLLTATAAAQAPAERYQASRAIYAKQGDGFLHDDSPEAITAIRTMWSALAEYLIERRTKDSAVPASTLSHELCLLTAEPLPEGAVQQTPERQCTPQSGDHVIVLDLGAGLLLAAPKTLEFGTVFLIGPRNGHLVTLWSIDRSPRSPKDPHNLIGAWRLEREGQACREQNERDRWGYCGPLYSSPGLLPPDAQKRPRFYLDAGYAQPIGATIAAQTSIWTWDGRQALLQWVDLHVSVVDDTPGASFQNGIFTVTAKTEFGSFFNCGSCNYRPADRLPCRQTHPCTDVQRQFAHREPLRRIKLQLYAKRAVYRVQQVGTVLIPTISPANHAARFTRHLELRNPALLLALHDRDCLIQAIFRHGWNRQVGRGNSHLAA